MFETVISYPSIAFDPYLQRKVQDIVTFAILGFVGDREQMDDDHPGIVRVFLFSIFYGFLIPNFLYIIFRKL